MRKRPFGRTGREVAVIGQGTWQLRDPARAAEALEEGLRLGLTHIDTAELYEQRSRSETLLGPVLQRHGGEGRGLFVASKVLPRNATAKGTVSACKDTLVRLGLEHIDLYYLHWREDGQALEEPLRALAGLVDAGWVRHVGVSNFDVADLEEAEGILGPGRIAANQVLYHLADRGAEAEVIPWCRAHGLAVVAYSPFGSGPFVTGAGLRALQQAAEEAKCTPRQAALAFLVREPHLFAIPKAERAEHVRENAGGRELPRGAVEAIDAAFPVRPGLRSI